MPETWQIDVMDAWFKKYLQRPLKIFEEFVCCFLGCTYTWNVDMFVSDSQQKDGYPKEKLPHFCWANIWANDETTSAEVPLKKRWFSKRDSPQNAP